MHNKIITRKSNNRLRRKKSKRLNKKKKKKNKMKRTKNLMKTKKGMRGGSVKPVVMNDEMVHRVILVNMILFSKNLMGGLTGQPFPNFANSLKLLLTVILDLYPVFYKVKIYTSSQSHLI